MLAVGHCWWSCHRSYQWYTLDSCLESLERVSWSHPARATPKQSGMSVVKTLGPVNLSRASRASNLVVVSYLYLQHYINFPQERWSAIVATLNTTWYVLELTAFYSIQCCFTVHGQQFRVISLPIKWLIYGEACTQQSETCQRYCNWQNIVELWER